MKNKRSPFRTGRRVKDWRVWALAGLVFAFPVGPGPAAAGQGPRETGIVVEEVGRGSVLEAAGLQAGDVLLSWERPPDPPTDPEGARGRIESAFDWIWVEHEQAPRGAVILTGKRDGEERLFTITPGFWESKVRPFMPDALLTDYLKGREHLEAGETADAADSWAKVATAEGVGSLRCWILLRLGEMWARQREWEKALTAFRSALDGRIDPFPESVLWHAVGDAYKRKGEFELAHQAYSSARKIRERAFGELSLVTAHSLNEMGHLAYEQGDPVKAADFQEGAAEILQRLAPESLFTAIALGNLGNVVQQLGDLDRATQIQERALEIAQALPGDGVTVAMVLNNLGSLAWDRGHLGESEDYFERSLRIQQMEGGDTAAAMSLHNLGVVARTRGDLDRAMDLLQRALEAWLKVRPDGIAVATTLGNLGNVVLDRGELELAEDFHQRAFEIWQKLAPDGLETATSLNNLGSVAWKRGDLAGAASFYQRAFEIRQELAGNSLDLAYSLDNLGSVASDRGDSEAAEDFFQRALKIRQEQAPKGLALAESLSHLGALASRRGDSDLAMGFHQRALQIRHELAPGSVLLAQTLHELGVLYRGKSPPELTAAQDLFGRALDTLDSQLARFGGSHDVRAGFRARYDEYYQDAIEVDLELAQAEGAFHILERSRARSFLERFAERDTVFTADIPEELDQRRRSRNARLSRLQRRLAKLNPQDPSAEDLFDDLRRLRDESRALEEEIRRASPKLAGLQYPQPLEVEAARSALDPGTVMLSYSVGRERTLLFVLTHDRGLTVRTLAVGEAELQDEVGYFREALDAARSDDFLGHRRGEDAERAGRRLYGWLIEPAEDVVATGERVVLVADGPLHRLPFAALIREVGDKKQYLAEWKPLHSVLSATVYAELQASRRDAPAHDGGPLLVAFGDPDYSRAGENATGDVRVRSARDRCAFTVDRLPASRGEVLGISNLYRNVRTYLGQGAREESVKSLDGDARIVHIAAHGCLDDRFPLSSGLFLTLPGDSSDDRDNGLLQAWEIFESVRLDADLVVLSACESGLGEEQGGEGLIGLSRAFQYAGAHTVAASLWQVDDQVTAELMVRFYRHLRGGKTKDAALRAAQLELIRAPIEVRTEDGQTGMRDVSAPYYWASFQLFGDWR